MLAELSMSSSTLGSTPADRKGGHLARLPGGRLILRETAQCPPEDRAAFEGISRHRFFNSNNLWLHLPTMLLMLALFRVYIFRAASVGSFSRWMGAPLVAMYVAYTVISYVIAVDSADVRVTLSTAVGDSVVDVLQPFTRQGQGTHNLVFDGTTDGGPVADAEVRYSVLSADHFFDYQGPGWWDFTDYDLIRGQSGEYYGSYGEVIAEGTGKTDPEGGPEPWRPVPAQPVGAPLAFWLGQLDAQPLAQTVGCPICLLNRHEVNLASRSFVGRKELQPSNEYRVHMRGYGRP